jgi:hypothetical protein
MSGSNQHVMQINLRRMELSDFTELPSTTSKPKGGGPGRQEGAAAERVRCRSGVQLLKVSRW